MAYATAVAGLAAVRRTGAACLSLRASQLVAQDAPENRQLFWNFSGAENLEGSGYARIAAVVAMAGKVSNPRPNRDETHRAYVTFSN